MLVGQELKNLPQALPQALRLEELPFLEDRALRDRKAMQEVRAVQLGSFLQRSLAAGA